MRCNRGKSDVKVERLREMVRDEHTERMTAHGARGWGDKKKGRERKYCTGQLSLRRELIDMSAYCELWQQNLIPSSQATELL